jgi:2Fe-2S ferredoxin
MPIVRVEPKGIELAVLEGETIMEAANRLGYQWPTVCGGQASCTTCSCEVEMGADALEPMSRLERTELERVFPTLERRGLPVRLACQARPTADVVVIKRGVRPRLETESRAADLSAG